MNNKYVHNLLRDIVKYKKAQWRIEQQLEIALKLDDETILSEVSAFCASAAGDPTDPDVTPLFNQLVSLAYAKQESEAQREQQQPPPTHRQVSDRATTRPDEGVRYPDDFHPTTQYPETD